MQQDSLRHLPFYKRIMEMQCRKDIIAENRFINKKSRDAVTPIRKKITTGFQNNKYRIYFFFGFCVLFSLNSVYDYVMHHTWIPKLFKQYLSFKQKPNTIIEVNKTRKVVTINQKNKQLAQIFLALQRNNIELTPIIMNSLLQNSNQPYTKDYIDMQEFVKFLELEQPTKIREKLRFRNGMKLSYL